MANARYKLRKLPKKYSPGFLRYLDHRCEETRRMRKSYDSIIEELGGEDSITTVMLTMVERFVFLKHQIEEWEQQIATSRSGELKDKAMGRWIQSYNSAVGLARLIGLRVTKKKVADLKAYVKGRSA